MSTVAFIARSITRARAEILRHYQVLSTDGADSGEIVYEGEATRFRIVTDERGLRGWRPWRCVLLSDAVDWRVPLRKKVFLV